MVFAPCQPQIMLLNYLECMLEYVPCNHDTDIARQVHLHIVATHASCAGENLLQLYVHAQSSKKPILAKPASDILLKVAQACTEANNWELATTAALEVAPTRPAAATDVLKEVVHSLHTSGNEVQSVAEPSLEADPAKHAVDVAKVLSQLHADGLIL